VLKNVILISFPEPAADPVDSDDVPVDPPAEPEFDEPVFSLLPPEHADSSPTSRIVHRLKNANDLKAFKGSAPCVWLF